MASRLRSLASVALAACTAGAMGCEGVDETDMGGDSVEMTQQALQGTQLNESFEAYPAGTSIGDYHWMTSGSGTLEVSDEAAVAGRNSFKIASRRDAAFSYNRAGAKFCTAVGDRKLSARFNVRFDSFASWTKIGISDNPMFAVWWWVRTDGTIFDDVTFAKLNLKTWYEVEINVDLDADNATIRIGDIVHSAKISSTWGTVARPLECLRISTPINVDQTIYVDQIQINAEAAKELPPTSNKDHHKSNNGKSGK